MTSQTPKARRNRPVQACTECKQVKLRCDAKESFPQSCSRCVSKGLECTIDATFRRTPARQHLEDITRELHSIRRSMNDVSDMSHSVAGSSEGSQNPFAPSTQPVGFCENEEALSDVEDAQLGNCQLSRADIVTIFSTFAIHFYPHLPIIDPALTIGSIQKANSFLFWTITAIVTQRLPFAYGRQSEHLLKPYRDLLGQAVISSPLALLTLQGLLYICTWPLSVDSQTRDHSWNLSGLALNASLHLGLHQPGHPTSLRSLGVFGESPMRDITWLGNFVVSTSLSQTAGFSPPIRALDDLIVIGRLISNDSVPRNFAAIGEIQRCVAKYTTMISESSGGSLTSSLVQLFEQELDVAKTTFALWWSPCIEAVFLAAKLHIYGIMAVNHIKRQAEEDRLSPNKSELFSHHTHLTKGLAIAVQEVQVMCNGLVSSPTSHRVPVHTLLHQETPHTSLPKSYFRNLVYAAFFLLRFFALGDWSTIADRDLAREHIVMVFNYLRKASIEPLDEAGRAAAAIDALSCVSPSTSGRGLAVLRISDRLAASIAYDSITVATELRNRPAQLSNDQEHPQQSLGLEAPIQVTSMDGDASLSSGSVAPLSAEDWQWNTTLPQYMMEDFSLPIFGISEDFLADAEMLS